MAIKKVDAKVSFEDADLSLFKNANANVTLYHHQQSSFEGDTLASIQEIDLKCLLRNF
jgi:hypothetical protein